jgi:hypothetical protein
MAEECKRQSANHQPCRKDNTRAQVYGNRTPKTKANDPKPRSPSFDEKRDANPDENAPQNASEKGAVGRW